MAFFKIFLISTFFLGLDCQSAEVDNFSYVKIELPDVSLNVDTLVNGYLKKIADKSRDCSREDVLKNTMLILDTNFPNIAGDLHYMPKGPYGLIFDSSIVYSGFESPSYSGCCAQVININNSKVGTDKVDHFFSSGFMYFLDYSENENRKLISLAADRIRIYKTAPRVSSEHEKMQRAIGVGTFQEEAGWGLSGTGVKSYGDMAANYKGFMFYKELIDGPNPYLKCVDGKFKQNRDFKIENYVDDAWDESINCSSFNSQTNRDIVYANMKKMGFDSCPVSPEKCATLVKKYGEEGRYFLHPKCLDPKGGHSQVEEAHENRLRSMKYLNIRDLGRAIEGAK